LIEALISSKTRVKLLLKFFLNVSNKAYLRGLEEEFGESTNAIRVELNRLEDAGMITAAQEGNKKIFKANIGHPLFNELHSILKKYVGVDTIIENILPQLGDVSQVFLTGEFASGRDNPIIDLEIVGNVHQEYLTGLVEKAQSMLTRRIRYIVFTEEEYAALPAMHQRKPKLLIWSK
jgi:DNA-binding transcriptional ArsR family regulator